MNEDKNNAVMLPDEIIVNKIYYIREQKVMIDRDLANLYGVETRILNQSVKRNIKRFPEDFMFQMTDEEFKNWKSQIVISNKENMGLRKPPLVFTEQGVAMLSSVLNSDIAIAVNIQIIRVFTKMKKMLSAHNEILHKLEILEKNHAKHDDEIILIFDYIKKLEQSKEQELEYKNRNRIGFKTKEN